MVTISTIVILPDVIEAILVLDMTAARLHYRSISMMVSEMQWQKQRCNVSAMEDYAAIPNNAICCGSL